MPRKRNPLRDKAREMWLASGKTVLLKEIAAALGVTESTIRKWKAQDKWEAGRSETNETKGSAPTETERKPDAETERSDTSEEEPPNPPSISSAKRRRGAPVGNRNAVGAGAPMGHKNALATGEYEAILFDSFSDDEKTLAAAVDGNKKELLLQQIKILLVRERRMLSRLTELRQGDALVDRYATTTKEPIEGTIVEWAAIMETKEVREEKEARDDRILRFEAALTRVQADLRRCIDSLRQLELAELKQTLHNLDPQHGNDLDLSELSDEDLLALVSLGKEEKP